jgi:hypothetical protein
MLNRTKGRLLLTLLVVTGFAGTLNNTTLTKKERKFVVSHLKDTKTELLNSLRGLSETRLNFKQLPDRWSIKECFYHLTLTETGLWGMLESTMKEPAISLKSQDLQITDEYLLKVINDGALKLNAPEPFQPGKTGWQSINEAISAFKVSRSHHLKYTKTTTEDLRNHFIQLPLGWVDCYQFIIFISGYCNRLTQQINDIIADPDFPKN